MSSSDFAGSVPFGGTCLIMDLSVLASYRTRLRARPVGLRSRNRSDGSRPLDGDRRAEFVCGNARGLGQAAKRTIAALRAFDYPACDMPPRIVLLASARENLAGALQGDFHIGQGSRVKAFRYRHSRIPGNVLLARNTIKPSRLRRPPAFCKKHSLQIRRVS